MAEQQPKVEGSGGLGPPQDFAGLDPRHFAEELQELGLLDFAQEVSFNRLTDKPGELLPPLAPAGPGPASAGPVGHNNPPTEPTYDVQQCQQANQAADLATARAMHVLHLAKVSLHQLVTSYNPRGAASGGTDGSSKRRKTSRGADATGSRSGSKGLRHFSMKVCEKVEAKGRTTYNEVADELVSEMSKMESMLNKNGQYDEKNIRRRVYDAINVLMAMDIIQKEKKEILWKGFPKLSHNSLDRLKAERLAKIKEVEQKQLYLQDMIEQQKALKKLLDRSAGRGNSATGTQLFLPFILVQAKPDATVEVKISEDMMDVQFDFYHSPFQIHDDSHVLKKMAEQQAAQLQQQQQPAFANALAGGLGLPWQGANGTNPAAGGILAAALAAVAKTGAGVGGTAGQPAGASLADPAIAQLAAATAQGQGGALNLPYAAAVAAAYQQQQQLLQAQQQQQRQQAQTEAGQPQAQQQQGHQQTQAQAQAPTLAQAQAHTTGQGAMQPPSQQSLPQALAQFNPQQLHQLHVLQQQFQQLQAQQQQQQQQAGLSLPQGLQLPSAAQQGPPSLPPLGTQSYGVLQSAQQGAPQQQAQQQQLLPPQLQRQGSLPLQGHGSQSMPQQALQSQPMQAQGQNGHMLSAPSLAQTQGQAQGQQAQGQGQLLSAFAQPPQRAMQPQAQAQAPAMLPPQSTGGPGLPPLSGMGSSQSHLAHGSMGQGQPNLGQHAVHHHVGPMGSSQTGAPLPPAAFPLIA